MKNDVLNLTVKVSLLRKLNAKIITLNGKDLQRKQIIYSKSCEEFVAECLLFASTEKL